MKEGHLVGTEAGIWFKTSHLHAIIHSHGKCQETLEKRADSGDNNRLFEGECARVVLTACHVGYLHLPRACVRRLGRRGSASVLIMIPHPSSDAVWDRYKSSRELRSRLSAMLGSGRNLLYYHEREITLLSHPDSHHGLLRVELLY